MPDLTIENIERIANDVRSQEIIFSRLPDELIDHICCDVEYEMNNGLDFFEAYRVVKQKMGSLKRLKEIQEETLYAVDTKYRYMKNTMKISGIAGTVLLGIAALLKMQHWAFAGVMLTLGALTLAFIFLPSSLGVLWKETHNSRRLFLFVSAFTAGFCYILGTLFKVQHWPGAGLIILIAAITGLLFIIALLVSKLQEPESASKKPVYIIGALGAVLYITGMFFKIMHWPLSGTFLISGMITISVIAFPLYTLTTWKEESHVDARFIFMVTAILMIILPSTLITLNLQQSYVNGYFPHLEQQRALYTYLNTNNDAFMARYKDLPAYPEMANLKARTDELLGLISKIESDMISEADEISSTVTDSANPARYEAGLEEMYGEIQGTKITKPVAAEYLLPGRETRNLLERYAGEHIKYFATLVPEEALQKYSRLVDPENYLPGQIPDDNYISLAAGLHSLLLYKNGILSAETVMLKLIAGSKETDKSK